MLKRLLPIVYKNTGIFSVRAVLRCVDRLEGFKMVFNRFPDTLFDAG